MKSFKPDSGALLTSIQNPWIKQLHRLQQASERKSQGLFLCEGTHLLHEAMATQWPIDSICFTQAWSDKNASLLASVASKVRLQLVTDQVLNYLATTEHPDGVVIVCRLRVAPSLETRISLALAIETVQEPGNLGALIRSVAATQADGIWMTPDSVDPYNSKVLRASAGQWFRKPPTAIPLRPWLDRSKSQSIQILAAAAGGRSYWDFDLTKPTIFLLGNEGAGLTSSIQQLADATISIPMANKVDSLNVGTTGALLLYEAKRQRSSKLSEIR
ncbi:MAG: RNA methyltransferase [Pirellulaceae bacterium]|nr:RNA methyltransferase [Pirellulaceae bacterium]